MREPSGRSLGTLLGWSAIVIGVLFLALGFAGNGTEAIDGILIGGLALLAGCVILNRRGRTGGTS